MKLERLEVRLRPGIKAEKEVIDALEAPGAAYGKKNELMRECLRRGYNALRKKAQSLVDDGSDEITILDALAQTFSCGDYRVMKTYLDASANVHVSGVLASDVLIPSSSKVVTTASLQDIATETLAVVAREVLLEGKALPSPIEEATAEVKATEVSADRVPARPDWSRMRGLAGSGGNGGDAK